MQTRGRRCEPWTTERTAAIRSSDGGDDMVWLVARMTWRRTDDTWRLRERVAATMEAVSLRLRIRFLTLFFGTIGNGKERRLLMMKKERNKLI